ncbi:MAG: phosphotransferase [Candidatus Hodgkinia cicadicola]
MSRLQKLREDIIPLLVKKNKFGKNVRLINVDIDRKYLGDDQYASNILFIDVVLENHKQRRESLVVKYEVAEETLREMIWTEMQFLNEIYAYEIVLPFLFETCGRSVDEFFPKFYHGVSNYGYNRPEDDIIILEDLRPKGFRLAEEKLYLDYDHVVVALKKLAEFHSLSYIAKHEKCDEFFEKVKKSKSVHVEAMQGCEHNIYIEPAERAFKPILLKNDKQQNAIIEKFLQRLKNTVQLLQDLGTPNEPTAVFCHGDYCRNNVLFKYDEATNKPIDIRFFDLGTARYTSPVIDLSFFLLLNTTAEMRQRHLDEFLNIYHGSVRESAPVDVAVPTLQQLVDEFQERAVYGFLHCSFFVPMMINEDKSVNLVDISRMDAKDIGKALTRYGGERGTQLISEMAQEIIDRGILKWTLNSKIFKQ